MFGIDVSKCKLMCTVPELGGLQNKAVYSEETRRDKCTSILKDRDQSHWKRHEI